MIKQYAILEITPPHDAKQTPLSTEQLFATVHTLGRTVSLWEKLLGRKKRYSLEIVATARYGIRFLIRVRKDDMEIIKKNILSYSPDARIKDVRDIFPSTEQAYLIREMRLSNHFAFPLQQQTDLKKHDPIAYLAGHMTKLEKNETVCLQIVMTPLLSAFHRQEMATIKRINQRILQGRDIMPELKRISLFWKLTFIAVCILACLLLYIFVLPAKDRIYIQAGIAFLAILIAVRFQHTSQKEEKAEKELSSEQKALQKEVGEKLGSSLFETSIRIYYEGEKTERINGLTASLIASTQTSYQSLKLKWRLLQKIPLFKRYAYFLLQNRRESRLANPILSLSEIASLYHFPYTPTTKTEDLVKIHAKSLPAPLSLKKAENLDVIFAKNVYGGTETPIGLCSDERLRHMAIFGATGTGKSTLMLAMIKEDIAHGKGLCILDPHGELAEAVLSCIPQERRDDLIWFNPDDLKHIIALNLMEQTPGLGEHERLREQEFIAESIISLFRKVFSDEWQGGNPHRIEYILRNTIHTAFTLDSPTLFTIYDLLTDPAFRTQAVKNLTDARLQKFWRNEFGKAGNWQQVKMISPVTARIGRFLFSPSAKRILDQKTSSIIFDEILNSGKILVCNLSKGNLGEDTSQVLGMMLLNKIQLAALRRARMKAHERRDFYLYVDEFQHFATLSFVQMLSEARKYRLNITLAEQTTAQQKDRHITDILLANTGTVVVFKTASTQDERYLLPQFEPYVTEGEIHNLPAFHFYMKLGALHPEEPFSGVTVPVTIQNGEQNIQSLIDLSNAKYARVEEPVPGSQTKKTGKSKSVTREENTVLPEDEGHE